MGNQIKTMSNSREEDIFMAKICEQTERFEDMVKYMKKVALLDQELTIEEGNLLSVAYKNAIGNHRTAWRALTSIETEEELNHFCKDILKVLDDKLIPSSENNKEANVF